MRYQNPNKSNNFFKQNIFNEKLNITKNLLYDTWGIPVKHNYSIYPPLAWMMASILSLMRSHACYNVVLSMPTNTVSIAVLNDVTLGCRDCLWSFQLRSIHSSPRDLNLNCWEARIPWPKHIDVVWRANFEWLVWAGALAEKHMTFRTPKFSLHSSECANTLFCDSFLFFKKIAWRRYLH